jgi:hypothetical protein
MAAGSEAISDMGNLEKIYLQIIPNAHFWDFPVTPILILNKGYNPFLLLFFHHV